jgi:hypothetical protein
MDGKSLGATLSCNKAPSKPASNADVIVRKPIDSEVLSKLSVLKTVPSELASPITVGFELIDHHGTLFARRDRRLAIAIHNPVVLENP